MAEASAHDVVIQSQSVGEASSIDVTGTTFTSNDVGGGDEQYSEVVVKDAVFDRTPDASAGIVQATGDRNDVDSNDGLADRQHVRSANSPTAHDAYLPASFQIDSSPLGTTQAETDSQPTFEAALVNGADSASYTESEDAGYQNLVGLDGNMVWSDTDPNKADGTEQSQEILNRSKRPAAFKAVSVTKNFLAKSGAVSAIPAKLGVDKSPSGLQSSSITASSAKPRLVAKTGRDVRSTNLSTSSAASGGPDASKVWNRNQPVAPPPQKQFTDEELKQQYGIHLATRLQADEAGKDSKWADIDDDEDDWAPPETLQWMDGTKSTLLPSEGQPSPAKQGRTSSFSNEAEDEDKSSATSTQQTGSISGVGKTILRPGARNIAQTKPGLVLKSVPETPVQIEKPAAPSSSKSPWAQLPPVDKVSPITFHPPIPPTSLVMNAPRRESSGVDSDAAAPSPAREIAADDFDRSWRESERGSRELFNSQSGRYEPVKAARRSSRQEGGFRLPSVLQRPTQKGLPTNTTESPFSPSGRDSQSWNRRRDSLSLASSSASNERQASADHDARLSPELSKMSEDRGSFSKPPASQGADSSAGTSPHMASSGPNQAYSAHAPELNLSESGETSAPEDPRIKQQQLMRERIELNRRRKQEEEAREEAEKKERIRLRMEALGPPSSPRAMESKPIEVALGSSAETKESDTRAALPTAESEPKASAVTPADPNLAASPAPQPVQTSDELPKQTPASEPLSSIQLHPSPTMSKPPSMEQGGLKSSSETNLATNNKAEVQQLPGLGQPVPAPERLPQSWNRLPQNLDSSAPWPTRPLAGGNNTNVWGPPTTDKRLGNGAFDNGLNKIPSMQLPSSHQMAPSPFRAPSMSPRMHFDNAHPTPSPPPYLQPRQDSLSQNSQAFSPSGSNMSPFPQHPIGHPPEQVFHPQPQQSMEMDPAKRAWQNFPGQSVHVDADLRARPAREYAGKATEDERSGVRPDFATSFRDTIRRPGPTEPIGQPRVVEISKPSHDSQNPGFDSRSINVSAANVQGQQHPLQTSSMPPAANGRASRFFGPSTVERSQLGPVIAASDADLTSLRPASPPPPDSAEHPAFVGTGSHPLVNIPAIAKVKLPPAPSASARRQDTVIMPTRYRSGPQPIVNSSAWQDRFNGLFGRKSQSSQQQQPPPPLPPPPAVSSPATKSIPSAPAAQVSSSTKEAFGEARVSDAATVSLPHGTDATKQSLLLFTAAEAMIETKPTEDDLMDEREFGSSPTVSIFHGSHPRERDILSYIPLGQWDSKPIARVETSREFSSTSAPLPSEALDSQENQASSIRIPIRILGKSLATRFLSKRTGAGNVTRKRLPRTEFKKRLPSGKSAATTNGASSQGHEHHSKTIESASNSKPSPKVDIQNSMKGNRGRKKNDEVSGNASAPSVSQQTGKPGGSTKDTSASGSQQQQRKPSSTLAKSHKPSRPKAQPSNLA